jgi:hypothetical protein
MHLQPVEITLLLLFFQIPYTYLISIVFINNM